jgi:hypothetical protein
MIRTMYFYLVVFMRRQINQVLVGWGMGPMGPRFGPFLYSQMAPFGSRIRGFGLIFGAIFSWDILCWLMTGARTDSWVANSAKIWLFFWFLVTLSAGSRLLEKQRMCGLFILFSFLLYVVSVERRSDCWFFGSILLLPVNALFWPS